MNLSSLYQEGTYLYFALTTLHPNTPLRRDSCSFATGFLIGTDSGPNIPDDPRSLGSSVTLSAANIPDDHRGLGSVTQPRLKAFENQEPYNWFFFNPRSPLTLLKESIDEITQYFWQFSTCAKLILTLYVDPIPGAAVCVLRDADTGEKVVIKSLTEQEYGTGRLFLFGFAENGAAVSLLVGWST